jgi:hypothetical protein
MVATKVVFRKFKEGDIIALFPREPGTNDTYRSCMSYQHIGQHGSADPGIVSITKLAKPGEYASLAKELRSLGYVLDIKTKITYEDMLERKRQINRISRGK